MLGFRPGLKGPLFEIPNSTRKFGGVLNISHSKILGGPNWVAWLLRASCSWSPHVVLTLNPETLCVAQGKARA